MTSKRKIAYYYDGLLPAPLRLSSVCSRSAGAVGSYSYGFGHVMKPHRMKITHDLVSAYGMLPKMDILVRVLTSCLS